MLIYMAPEAASWNSQAENMVDPTICMESCSLANSRGTPVTTLGGSFPCRDSAISTNPGGGIHHQLTLPPGLEHLLASPLGCSLWVSATLHCRSPRMTLWNRPCCSCYGCSYRFCCHSRWAPQTSTA